MRMTDNWLELTVRFIAEDHGVRDLKDAMTRDILAALDAAGIGVASATFEIVGLPTPRTTRTAVATRRAAAGTAARLICRETARQRRAARVPAANLAGQRC